MTAMTKEAAQLCGHGWRSGAFEPGWTQEQTEAFLDALAETANVAESARVAGVGASMPYHRKHRDVDFAADWARALDIGYCELELLLLRHARNGAPRTERVTSGEGEGAAVKQVKTVHAYPHGLAIRLLAAHKAEVERFRLAQAARHGDGEREEDDVTARVRAEMIRVRERLAQTAGAPST